MENPLAIHILQKKGILRSFSLAKIVKSEEIEALKALIKGTTGSKKEYDRTLKKELAKLSNPTSKKNAIPGIIDPSPLLVKRKLLFTIAHKIADGIKKSKFAKGDLAFIISAMISRLELSQGDFSKLNEELEDEQSES